MNSKSTAILKFVGTISLGLLTGVSYTLSTISVPALASLPNATSASHTLTHLITRASTDLNIWTGISTSSFVLAYFLSPRGARHPYLLWTSLFVVASRCVDFLLPYDGAGVTVKAKSQRTRERVVAKGEGTAKAKGRNLEASYEVLGDSHSDGDRSASASDVDVDLDIEEDSVNGEEIRRAMEGFKFLQSVKTGVAGTGLVMSIVGIWGDGF